MDLPDYRQLDDDQLKEALMKGVPAAWDEFTRRKTGLALSLARGWRDRLDRPAWFTKALEDDFAATALRLVVRALSPPPFEPGGQGFTAAQEMLKGLFGGYPSSSFRPDLSASLDDIVSQASDRLVLWERRYGKH